MLARDDIFDLWAPASSPWSTWAKPLLFAHLPAQLDDASSLSPRLDAPTWAPAPDGSTVLIADLEGPGSLVLAARLAVGGFRPVPLFNALPSASGAQPVVDVDAIIDTLLALSSHVAPTLRSLPAGAPPVFLLDALRRHGQPRPGDFDNRSISLPTDFPSASFLLSRGVARVLVLTEVDALPATDLSHTLLRYQSAGLPILVAALDERFAASQPRAVQIRKPKWFRSIWHNALVTVGLQRSPFGGFGAVLPSPSAG